MKLEAQLKFSLRIYQSKVMKIYTNPGYTFRAPHEPHTYPPIPYPDKATTQARRWNRNSRNLYTCCIDRTFSGMLVERLITFSMSNDNI